ncbi:FdtA/QdtA family cupin domain-containing protein [Winogradskyella maritima]|uniref:FdtA/QdtA family cupin domain-containing protein n=1 Tax=Winogradskyella maritima TaxID=1517766 RepID=A0ABV8AJQ3_9FLAO|nr:FdtA/QdtA family cupin domain-containing protein [Winogradskyella maritima]
MNTKITDCITKHLPKIEDHRGNISVIEKDVLPFAVKRVYYLYDVPSNSRRGGHAHRELHECLVAVSGSFDVILNDGENSKTVTLNKPDIGLIIPDGIWRELENFSSGSVCLVLASQEFNEDEYIRDFNDFKAHKFN